MALSSCDTLYIYTAHISPNDFLTPAHTPSNRNQRKQNKLQNTSKTFFSELVRNRQPDAGRRGIVRTRRISRIRRPKEDLKSDGNYLNVQNTYGIFCQPNAQYEELKQKYAQRTSRDSSSAILFSSLGFEGFRSGATALLSTPTVATADSGYFVCARRKPNSLRIAQLA